MKDGKNEKKLESINVPKKCDTSYLIFLFFVCIMFNLCIFFVLYCIVL